MIAEANGEGFRSEEDIRVVLVYGQDTRLGQCLCAKLNARGFTVIARSSEAVMSVSSEQISKAVRTDLLEKKADVVVNCLVDPDPAVIPEYWMERYVIPSQAILQQCRLLGTRLILCSHAQVFGTQGSRELGYKEYDPPVPVGNSVWRPVLAAVEYGWHVQNSLYNSCALNNTNPQFKGYMFRLGEILTPKDVVPVNGSHVTKYLSLDAAIGSMVDHRKVSRFESLDPNTRLSPISATTVVNELAGMCEARVPIASGIYHLASTGGPTLSDIAKHLEIRLGRSISISKTDSNANTCPRIGIDSSQDLNANFYYRRTGKTSPTWKDEVDLVLRSRSQELAPPVLANYA